MDWTSQIIRNKNELYDLVSDIPKLYAWLWVTNEFIILLNSIANGLHRPTSTDPTQTIVGPLVYDTENYLYLYMIIFEFVKFVIS